MAFCKHNSGSKATIQNQESVASHTGFQYWCYLSAAFAAKLKSQCLNQDHIRLVMAMKKKGANTAAGACGINTATRMTAIGDWRSTPSRQTARHPATPGPSTPLQRGCSSRTRTPVPAAALRDGAEAIPRRTMALKSHSKCATTDHAGVARTPLRT